MKAYKVYDCKIEERDPFSWGQEYIWEGVVVCEDNESIADGIKQKLGLKELYAETHGQTYEYEEIDYRTVQLEDLTIGELMKVISMKQWV